MAIAHALEKIATLLELKNENPFKVRAYQTGARALEAIEEAELAKLIAARATIPRESFARALIESADPEFRAETYLRDTVIADAAELEPLVERVLAANPGQVAAYKGGKDGLLGFFVGQVMKETQGKADPKVVNELLRAKLSS